MLSRNKTVFLITILILISPCLALAKNKKLESEATKLIERVLEKDRGIGIMAAVYRKGKLVWSGTSGYADLEAKIKMQKSHRLRIGSVSKPFTAILALKLFEKGKLDLDKPIEGIGNLPGITPRLLGSHLSGIRHYDFSNLLEANNVYYFSSLEESLNIYEKELVVAKPNTKFLYSSIGYNVLGIAIEKNTKTTFAEALSNEITKPLGLRNTLTDNSLKVIKNRGRFYTIGNPNPLFPWMKKNQIINTFARDSSDYYPSGGLLSNAEDLAKFTDKVFDSDFLSKKSKAIIKTPAKTSDGKKAEYTVSGEKIFYSFGWSIRYQKDGSIFSFGHNGETNGAYALVRYFPKTKTSVAAIANYNVVAKEPAFFELAGKKLPVIFEKTKQ